jgi:hypothetical protein
MKKTGLCLAILAILACMGCAVTDVDRTANLTQYKSFGWGKSDLDVKNPAYKSDLIDAHIKASVENEFAKKGISYKPRRPDLLVSYKAYTETWERSYGGTYYYPYYYPYSLRFFPYDAYMMSWGPFWGGQQGTYVYTHGTLILDVKDRRTGKLIWRGLVQGSVDNLKTLNKSISKGIRAILKKYPAATPSLLTIPKKETS